MILKRFLFKYHIITWHSYIKFLIFSYPYLS